MLVIGSEHNTSEVHHLSHQASHRSEVSLISGPWNCLHCIPGKGLKQEGSWFNKGQRHDVTRSSHCKGMWMLVTGFLLPLSNTRVTAVKKMSYQGVLPCRVCPGKVGILLSSSSPLNRMLLSLNQKWDQNEYLPLAIAKLLTSLQWTYKLLQCSPVVLHIHTLFSHQATFHDLIVSFTPP